MKDIHRLVSPSKGDRKAKKHPNLSIAMFGNKLGDGWGNGLCKLEAAFLPCASLGRGSEGTWSMGVVSQLQIW